MAEKETPHITERLNWLFENVRKPDGSKYTNQEVEDETEALGLRVGATAVWKIRNGQTQNPGYLTLRSLANLFRVPVTFFYDGILSVEEEARLKSNPAVLSPNEIALRTIELDESQRQAVLAVIEAMRKRNQ